MIENQIGKRFAEALSDSIQEEGKLSSALTNLQNLVSASQDDPMVSRFFIHPSIPDEKKSAFVKELCDKINAIPEVTNLLKILLERRKMTYLKNIVEYFEYFVMKRLNQVRVDIVSASPLSENQINKLKTSLDQVLGKSAIIESKVDESLIGGLRLSVGSLVADASIKNRLALLKRSIESEEVLR